jgi:hypothetical protein
MYYDAEKNVAGWQVDFPDAWEDPDELLVRRGGIQFHFDSLVGMVQELSISIVCNNGKFDARLANSVESCCCVSDRMGVGCIVDEIALLRSLRLRFLDSMPGSGEIAVPFAAGSPVAMTRTLKGIWDRGGAPY